MAGPQQPRRAPHKPGARSIRGSLGAYLKASLAALALLALVLWWGWDRTDPAAGAPRVRLAADAGWKHAAVESGGELITLRPGDEATVPPGVWRVTLVPVMGEPWVGSVELGLGERVELGR